MEQPPIALSDFGSFHVGGRIVEVCDLPVSKFRISEALLDFTHDPNGRYAIEAAYVHYALPAHVTRDPVLLVHGGGMCGTVWETTPDGRPGWQKLLLQRGHPVYVIDMVERGRAGFCSLEGIWPGAPIMRTLEDAWDVFRLGPRAKSGEHIPFEGQKFPWEHFQHSAFAWSPRWLGNDAPALKALKEALEKIGEVHVIAHSTGCGAALQAAAESKNVLSLALVEPAGLPNVTGPDATPIATIWGDFLEQNQFWTELHAQSLQQLESKGLYAQEIQLSGCGLAGHSHMPMQDRENEKVLNIVLRFIAKSEKPAYPALEGR